jgi:hypothetical protein
MLRNSGFKNAQAHRSHHPFLIIQAQSQKRRLSNIVQGGISGKSTGNLNR